MLSLDLERVIDRASGILINTMNIATVLRVGQKCLSYRRGATCHLFNPTVVRNGNAVQTGLTGLELVVELGTQ